MRASVNTGSADTAPLQTALVDALRRKVADDAVVTRLERMFGGASRETYRGRVETGAAAFDIVIRCDPQSSFIESDRTIEYHAGASFSNSDVPIAEPLLVDLGDSPFGRPFICHAFVQGGIAPTPFQRDPYGVHAAAFGVKFFQTLGKIAATSPSGALLAADTLAQTADWRSQLDMWATRLLAAELHPQPLARAAIRALRRNPPRDPGRLSIVHGDYRSGNVLHDGQGNLLAVIDWEMAHLGDPLEDLAWAISPLWNHGCTEKVGGMLERDQAIALWEASSGRTAPAAELLWWELFAAVKGQALWTGAARQFIEAKQKDPVCGLLGWSLLRRQDEILAKLLDEMERGI